uniref:lysosome-associated membrane glycoprotein 2 isoform X2 n=1 Tax=Semicossyphus pulcher TaxID=241346 RepID=UPI0037E7BABE
MYRYAAFVLLLASGIAVQLSHGVEVRVTDSEDKLCIYANVMVNFSVSYEVSGNKTETAEIELPSKVTTNGSDCSSTSSMLKINFGEGHSWSVNFTINGSNYEADSITFAYNLGDKSLFPNATSNDTIPVIVTPEISGVVKDTCYSCKSSDTIESKMVNQTLWNVLIQAFVSNNSKSENITSCAADVPVTPAPPTTHAPTAAPTTKTTPAPVPTTTPTPTLPPPSVGNYSVKRDENSTACLLAEFGLRIGVKQGEKYQEMNFDPNGTSVTGKCGDNSSDLVVTSNTMTIMLTFTNDTKKFRLHALNITGKTSSGAVFSEANTNLSLWEAAVGASYMCNKEQNYTITGALTLFTFNLRVQPFGVKKGVFSTAHECSLDDTSILIPVIVAAALGGLILIVVIAYVIGRRKTYVGYQTL